jgi:RNA polymerase sigma factor (sigma-70 family)
MSEPEKPDSGYRDTLEQLNQRECWGLTGAQIDAYLEQLLPHMPTGLLAPQLEHIFRHYHTNHRLVAALRDRHSPNHEPAWCWVKHEIGRVMQFKRLEWSRDRAVEADDLVQTVQAELVRALGDYRFESSLRTWLQSVTVRRLQRFHRDGSAAKRTALPEPLEAADSQPLTWQSVEPEVLARALIDQINRVLDESGDRRLSHLFKLRIVDEQSAETIGKLFDLHPSRVRALLKLLRDLLRHDARLRTWRGEHGDPHDTDEPGL